jgi:hypothetical protein
MQNNRIQTPKCQYSPSIPKKSFMLKSLKNSSTRRKMRFNIRYSLLNNKWVKSNIIVNIHGLLTANKSKITTVKMSLKIIGGKSLTMNWKVTTTILRLKMRVMNIFNLILSAQIMIRESIKWRSINPNNRTRFQTKI